MGLLSKLKSMLGLEESERAPGSGVDVTVEREPDADGDGAAEAAAGTADDAAGTETADAEAPLAEDDTDESADDDEYVTTDANVGTDAADDESAADPEPDADEDADAEPEPDDLTEIKGVGPAYADRLNDAGVTTFAALADADPDELAAETDLSPKRVGRWIDRAGDR